METPAATPGPAGRLAAWLALCGVKDSAAQEISIDLLSGTDYESESVWTTLEGVASRHDFIAACCTEPALYTRTRASINSAKVPIQWNAARSTWEKDKYNKLRGGLGKWGGGVDLDWGLRVVCRYQLAVIRCGVQTLLSLFLGLSRLSHRGEDLCREGTKLTEREKWTREKERIPHEYISALSDGRKPQFAVGVGGGLVYVRLNR